jgi:hypothetical protein
VYFGSEISVTRTILKIMKHHEAAQLMNLRSRVPGRERWEVACVRNHPNWAASIESIVGTEEGVESVIANPATGRVLVEYDPSRITAPVEVLLQRALAFRPMTETEVLSTRHAPKAPKVLAAAATAELGCLLLKGAFLGICPWTTVAMCSTAFLFHRVVSDKPRRIRHHKNRAQVMEHSGDNGIYSAQGRQA